MYVLCTEYVYLLINILCSFNMKLLLPSVVCIMFRLTDIKESLKNPAHELQLELYTVKFGTYISCLFKDAFLEDNFDRIRLLKE
jgi:hypothetical protein